MGVHKSMESIGEGDFSEIEMEEGYLEENEYILPQTAPTQPSREGF